jgi:hypothetical protein
MPLDWGKLDASQPKSNLDWGKLDGSTPKPAAPEKAPEAHPTLSKILSLAKGADDALLGLPHEAATFLRAATHGESFKQAREDIDKASKIATTNHPYYYGGGLAAGTVATLPLLPEAAPTVVGRAVQGAKIGAGMAGVSEFTNSHDLNKAAEATLIGGATGGLLTPALEGVAHVGSKVASPVISTVRGAINPESEAAKRIVGAIEMDKGQGIDFSKAAQSNVNNPVAIADMGGDTVKSLARSAGNVSPEAANTLNNFVDQRFETQFPRIKESIGASGISNVAKRDAIEQAAKAANKPIYDKAYSFSANGLWNDELANLVNSPAVKTAISEAETRGANQAVISGNKPVRNPFVTDANGNVSLKVNKDGSTAYPNLQFWDVVKQNLDEKINIAKRQGGDIRDLVGLKQKLVNELDNQNPYYAKARGTAQTFFQAKDATEAGAKFVGSNFEIDEAKKAISGMNKHERALFADGFATKLIDNLSGVRDRVNLVNKIYNSPKAREQITLALGPDKAAQIEAQLHVEAVMDGLRTAVQGNSTTAKQMAALGLVGAGGAYLTDKDISAGGLVGAAAGLAHGKVDAQVAKQVAKLLVSNDANKIKALTNMAAKNQKVMSALKTYLVKLTGVSGGATGNYAEGQQ